MFKKGKHTVETYKFTTFNIFAAHFINSALIIMLAQNSFLWSEEERASFDRGNLFVGVYDEFNSEWFLNVGSALLITQAFMLVVPHMFIVIQAIYLGCYRCYDRGFSFDTKNTKKIIQSEYEDLYTGPWFILEVRYGQVLGVVFVAFTFSAGIPLLLPLTFFILLVQYWVDKFLLFNYYRKTPYFTRLLSSHVVDLLPWAVLIHYVFGGIMYSYPYMLKSTPVPWFGNNTQYFNKERLGQTHMVIYFIFACLNAILFLFEKPIVYNWNFLAGGLMIRAKQLIAYMMGKPFDEVDENEQGFVLTDDLLMEVNFGQLYKMYKVYQKDIRRYKM